MELTLTSNLPFVLAFASVFLSVWLYTRRPTGIPPGPLLFVPILGNLLQIGTNPLKSFRKMRKQYGEVFSVYCVNRLVIIINGLENLKEAFIKNGDIFSERPYMFFQHFIAKGRGITFSNGQIWKEQRKFAFVTLRNFGMGRNILEVKIQEEVSAFLKELAAERGQPMDIQNLLHTSVSNVICAIVFGARFQYEDPKLLKFLKAMNEEASLSPLVEFMPFLRYLPGDCLHIHRTASNVDMVEREFINPSIEEHLLRYDEDNIDDFISAFIKEMKRKESLGEKNTSMDRDNLRVTIGELFVAGTETTATTIRWLLLYFLHFPEIQDKCFAEINNTVGCDRPVSLKDKTDLPFVEATIMETLRFSNITPFSLPHSVSVDTTFKGYTIPKGSIILPSIDSVLTEPDIWGDPEKFRPSRFFDENGKLTKPEELIPFFIGRRNCLGESLARMELFLFVSNMVQKFKFVKVEDEPLSSLEGEFGLTHFPKSFTLRSCLRSS